MQAQPAISSTAIPGMRVASYRNSAQRANPWAKAHGESAPPLIDVRFIDCLPFENCADVSHAVQNANHHEDIIA